MVYYVASASGCQHHHVSSGPLCRSPAWVHTPHPAIRLICEPDGSFCALHGTPNSVLDPAKQFKKHDERGGRCVIKFRKISIFSFQISRKQIFAHLTQKGPPNSSTFTKVCISQRVAYLWVNKTRYLTFINISGCVAHLRFRNFQNYFIGINFGGYKLSRFREFFWRSRIIPAKYNFHGSYRNIDQKSPKMASK